MKRPTGSSALVYFTERLDPDRTRQALAALLKRPKRGQAFDTSTWIGLAVDGTGAGCSEKSRCELCHAQGKGYGHKLVAISVVGAGLDLPFDVEFYASGENERTRAATSRPGTTSSAPGRGSTGPVPHGQEPLAHRERWLGRCQEPLRTGAHRPPPSHERPRDALVTFLAMCLERLYRLRYLRRGTHPPYSAIEFFRFLWLNLAAVEPYDTS